jgi:hypothetical protein
MEKRKRKVGGGTRCRGGVLAAIVDEGVKVLVWF